jgi:hypothetical protein
MRKTSVLLWQLAAVWKYFQIFYIENKANKLQNKMQNNFISMSKSFISSHLYIAIVIECQIKISNRYTHKNARYKFYSRSIWRYFLLQ